MFVKHLIRFRTQVLVAVIFVLAAAPEQLSAQFGNPFDAETAAQFEEIRSQLSIFDETEEETAPGSRRASSVLRSLADELAGGERKQKPNLDASPDEKQMVALGRLSSMIQTGQWDKAQELLKGLPKEAAGGVYTGLLSMLAGDPLAGVSLEEFLPIVNLSPGELQTEQITLLAELLKRISGQTQTPAELLKQIQGSTGHLGTASDSARFNTAKLLMAAGRLDDAGNYLPAFEVAIKSDDPRLLNLSAEYYQKKSQPEPNQAEDEPPGKPDPTAVERSWELTIKALSIEEKEAEPLSRAVSLLLDVPKAKVQDWLGRVFQEQPALGLRLLASVAEQYEAVIHGAAEPRLQALRRQQILVEPFLKSADRDSQGLPLRLLAQIWIREAQKSAGGELHRLKLPKEEEIPPLPRNEIAGLEPNPAWIEKLDPDTALHVRYLSGFLAAQTRDQAKTFETIRFFAQADPGLASQLANRFLESWVNHQAGIEEVLQAQEWSHWGRHSGLGFSHHGIGGFSGFSQQIEPVAVSLTRAKQARNLHQLRKLFAELEGLGVSQLDETMIAKAFDVCHSPAEVYRREDIRMVLKEPASLSAEISLALISKMREKLAGQWRQQELQEQAGTKRTDKELVAEIKRGYDLASDVLENALERNQENSKLGVLLATVLFDQAEFLYGQKVDLKTYISLRDRSFGHYQEAAARYASRVKTEPVGEKSIDVFWQWFQSSLGASDLAYLTRQDAPERDQIEEIAAMIRGLGGDLAEEHLKLFGERLAESQENVPQTLRPSYLREGVRIVGDDPSGEKARERLQYYEELLAEVRLHLEVDGSTNVGNGRPFGVQISIRNTTAVGYEGGGLIDLADLAGSELDPTESLKEELQRKLGETFSLDVVRFHQGDVAPGGFGRPRWRQTPLAYIVLRTKDASVDRIPSLLLDLPFNDGDDYVMLPIVSPVVLIDAKSDRVPAPQLEDVAIQQILDDRKLRDEEPELRLEVTATAAGLIPDLDQLVDLTAIAKAGFEIAQRTDHGLDVTELIANGSQVKPQSRRSWTLELKPSGELPAEKFVFPPALEASFANGFERYADADIVKTEQVVALSYADEIAGRWLWFGLGALALLGLLAAGIAVYRKREAAADKNRYRRPDRLTPFTTLSFLERLRSDESVSLTESERRELDELVARLQEEFFRTNGQNGQANELGTHFDRWLARAETKSHTGHPSNGEHRVAHRN